MDCIWGEGISPGGGGSPWGGASVHPKMKLRERGGGCLQGPRDGTA